MDADNHGPGADRGVQNADCGTECKRGPPASVRFASRVRPFAIIALGLVLATAWLYWPVLRCGFLTFDDPEYVTDNPIVQQGLGPDTVLWAFRSGYQANWHPLTWLTHALDCQLYGLRPAGHHATNLALHLANTALLFLFLVRSTGALWRAASVAALFAWHPLRVESVAWVAERKDVLSGFFFMLTLLAYQRYASRTEARRAAKQQARSADLENRTSGAKAGTTDAKLNAAGCAPGVRGWPVGAWYAGALLCFALGLMSKPMLVTLPFVLLLIDLWPLGRLPISNPKSKIRNLVLEKLPFFALSAASSLVTYTVQSAGYAVHDRPWAERFANAALACFAYARQTFWPTDLAIFYPHLPSIPMGAAVAAALLLTGITAFCLWTALHPSTPEVQRGAFELRHPSRRALVSTWLLPAPLLVGWLWFLGMLVPVIGLIQVGAQSRADRYTYLPSIGLSIMIVWSIAEGLRRVSGAPTATASRPSADPISNKPALGAERPSSLVRASSMYLLLLVSLTALAALPAFTRSYLSYWTNSEALFAHALEVTGPNAVALNHLGVALVMQERFAEAKTCFEQALALDPTNTQAPFNLATVLLKAGQVDQALALLGPALRGKPVVGKSFAGVGMILTALKRPADAVLFYRKALEAEPTAVETLNNLAWLLATSPNDSLRDGTEAVRLAEQACALTRFRAPVFIGTLAAAYAEAGRFDEAIATAERARDLARAQGDPALASRNEELLKLYRAGKPFREEATTASQDQTTAGPGNSRAAQLKTTPDSRP